MLHQDQMQQGHTQQCAFETFVYLALQKVDLEEKIRKLQLENEETRENNRRECYG